jgi:hypothetical protein
MTLEHIKQRLEIDYAESFKIYEDLTNAFELDGEYDETYEDTLARKYEEGFSDALRLVLSALKEVN